MQDHEDSPLNPEESDSESTNQSILQETASSPDIHKSDLSVDDQEEGHSTEESHVRQGFRKFIRWTTGLLIVFGLGFLVAIFTIYNPKIDQLDQLQNELISSKTTISELETEISTQQDDINNLNEQINALNLQVETLEKDKQKLTENQDSINLQIALLRARADVIAAQVKLYEENPSQARVLLESASQTMTIIETLLPDDLKDVVAPLKTRLELAIGGIIADPVTAITDLNKIAGDLREIENAKVLE